MLHSHWSDNQIIQQENYVFQLPPCTLQLCSEHARGQKNTLTSWHELHITSYILVIFVFSLKGHSWNRAQSIESGTIKCGDIAKNLQFSSKTDVHMFKYFLNKYWLASCLSQRNWTRQQNCHFGLWAVVHCILSEWPICLTWVLKGSGQHFQVLS